MINCQSSPSDMAAEQVPQIPKWNLKIDYIEACNCDHGCPCNFNGFPTYGFCRSLVLNSIREGNYGDVKLNGVDVVVAASWPKAIHEGNGTVQFYISKHASEVQRDAVINIFTGKAKGEDHLHYLRQLSSMYWSRSTLIFRKGSTARRAASPCLE